MKFELELIDDFADVFVWEWWVSDKKHGVLARSPDTYSTEAEARSAIAKARKGFAGAKFAKVEIVDTKGQLDPEGLVS